MTHILFNNLTVPYEHREAGSKNFTGTDKTIANTVTLESSESKKVVCIFP